MGLKRTTPPDPGQTTVSLETLRVNLRLPPGDGSLDDELRRLIAAASEIFEEATWRALLTQTWRLTLRRFPCHGILLPRPPLVEVTSVQYVDADGVLQTLDEELYHVAADCEPARLEPAYGEVWPTTRCQNEAVRVTYTAGYGTTPESIPALYRDAMLLIAADRFKNREATSDRTLTQVPMSAAWILSGARVEADESWFHLAE